MGRVGGRWRGGVADVAHRCFMGKRRRTCAESPPVAAAAHGGSFAGDGDDGASGGLASGAQETASGGGDLSVQAIRIIKRRYLPVSRPPAGSR